MNRKDRRAARSNRVGSASAQGIGPGAMSANLFASAVERFNAGRLDDAERLCRDVLMFNKGHFDALHMLGLIAVRVGNLTAAAELYGRALAVNGRSAECHFNIAQVFRAQGRNRDAVAHLGEATAIKRDYVAAHVSLADMLAAQNDLEDARARYEQALAIDPRLVDARHGLANLLRQLGRLDEAAAQFRQVVALRPDYAEAFSNLGVVLAAQGRWADAAEQYQRAIAIKPELVDVYRNLARALGAAGRADEALAAIMHGLAIGETDEAKAVFVQCAQAAANVPPGEAFRDVVARALTEGWGRSADLSPLAAFLFMTSESGHAAAERILSAPQLAAEGATDLLAALSSDRLLRALLEIRAGSQSHPGALPHRGAFRAVADGHPDRSGCRRRRAGARLGLCAVAPVLHQRICLCRNGHRYCADCGLARPDRLCIGSRRSRASDVARGGRLLHSAPLAGAGAVLAAAVLAGRIERLAGSAGAGTRNRARHCGHDPVAHPDRRRDLHQGPQSIRRDALPALGQDIVARQSHRH